MKKAPENPELFYYEIYALMPISAQYFAAPSWRGRFAMSLTASSGVRPFFCSSQQSPFQNECFCVSNGTILCRQNKSSNTILIQIFSLYYYWIKIASASAYFIKKLAKFRTYHSYYQSADFLPESFLLSRKNNILWGVHRSTFVAH